ncbi:MAG: cheY3 [Proteobacteria bacterium]|nr:cheY3 [Pseudomonadota bacterium]
MRILVVDDDSFSGEMTSAILEDAGHQSVVVDSAVEAVETLADPGFAVVISDMNMPFVSGLELFATLREQGCDLPFILLSGDDPDELRQREPRLDACLAKDSELPTTLPQALGRVLAARAR